MPDRAIPKNEFADGRHDIPMHTFVHGSQAEAEFVLWEVMQALHMAEFIHSRLLSDTRWDWRQWDDSDIKSTLSALPAEERRGPEVTVVPFGIFRAEAVPLPTVAEDRVAATALLETIPLEPPSGCHPNIYPLLECIYLSAGVPNHYKAQGMPTLPPPLQFFQFLMRQHFGLAFKPAVFNVYRNNGWETEYEEFRHRATIFANGPPEDAPGRLWQQSATGFELLIPWEEYEEILAQGMHYKSDMTPNPRFARSQDTSD